VKPVLLPVTKELLDGTRWLVLTLMTTGIMTLSFS